MSDRKARRSWFANKPRRLSNEPGAGLCCQPRHERTRARCGCAVRTAAISITRTARVVARRSGRKPGSAGGLLGSRPAAFGQRGWDCPWSDRVWLRGPSDGNDPAATSRRRPDPFCASTARTRWESVGNRTTRGQSAFGFSAGNLRLVASRLCNRPPSKMPSPRSLRAGCDCGVQPQRFLPKTDHG